MLNRTSLSTAWHHLNRTVRLLLTVLMLLCIFLAAVVLSVRYWFLPNIESYRENITRSVSDSLGAPVQIGRIEGEWQGLRPRLDFFDVRILDKEQRTALILPELHNILSWTSLFTFSLRLHTLEINHAELLIYRNQDGQILIGGLPVFDQQQEGTDDWILHQPRVIVNDAKLIWWDQQRKTKPFIVNNLDMRLENFFNHHDFALSFEPAHSFAGKTQLKGRLRGNSLSDFSQWQGELFGQIDYIDLASLEPWLDLPAQLNSGQGGGRVWLELLEGKPVALTADLDLLNVATQLDNDSPQLVLDKLNGRTHWAQSAYVTELNAENILLKQQGQASFAPINFSYRRETGDKAQGHFDIEQLNLAELNGLTAYLPLPSEAKHSLLELQPEGLVKQLALSWTGSGKNFSDYQYSAQLDNFQIQKSGDIPGLSGLNAHISGKQGQGRAKLNSEQFLIDATGIMREPLHADKFQAELVWAKKADEWDIQLQQVVVTNRDLAGIANAHYLTQAGTDGILELDIQLSRADARNVARYIPVATLGQEGGDWLSQALLAGNSNNVHVFVQGNLTDFANGNHDKTKVKVSANAQNVILAFDSEWPQISDISGKLQINGSKLEVLADKAMMAGAKLNNVAVSFPDMTRDDLPLVINGKALANASTFMDFIQHSPVRGYIDGVTDDMSAKGAAELDLSLYIPLFEPTQAQKIVGYKPLKVDGKVKLTNAEVQVTSDLPALQQVTGILKFSEQNFSTEAIKANWLDGPVQVNVLTKPDGSAEADLSGRTSVAKLRPVFDFPLSQYLSGELNWTGKLKLHEKKMELLLSSDLRGVNSSLPAPYDKATDTILPLQLDYQQQANSPTNIRVKIGSLLGIQAQLLADKQLKQLVLNFSNQAAYPQKEGLWLLGQLPDVLLPDWVNLLATEFSSSDSSSLAFAGADLQIKALNGYYLAVKNLSLKAQGSKEGINAQLNGKGLVGTLSWNQAAAGKLTVALSELSLQKGGGLNLPTPDKPTMLPTQLPALQLSVNQLSYMDKELGKLELIGHPEQQAWRLRRFKLESSDATVFGEGEWTGDLQQANTSLKLHLDSPDMGKFLSRMGYPDQVKGANGSLELNTNWDGSPQMFSLARMSGDLNLETGSGQFLQMQPGMGKLLSVFSLQALPRRLTLDFSDVFSQGFQFDDIRAKAQIKQGVMVLSDTHIDGSAAKVAMEGSVNLLKETQQLKVTVMPTVGNSVSLLGAFVVNPLVGIGTFVLNKVLGNPLDKMVAFEYNISGGWEEPLVEKAGSKQVVPELKNN